MQPFKREIEAIAGSISARPGSEAEQIQDALRRRVFGNGFDQPRGDVFGQLFLRNYRAAQAAGETTPRVLLRFGGYHPGAGWGAITVTAPQHSPTSWPSSLISKAGKC